MKALENLELLQDTAKLRKLIIENPDMPLMIFVGQDTYNDEYMYTACTSVKAKIGEVLDCDDQVTEGEIFCDRTEFEDKLRIYLEDEYDVYSDSFVAKKLREYDQFWKQTIIVWADN